MNNYAVEVFKEEAQAILNLIKYLDENFSQVVKEILKTDARVIITGIGKSGVIGKKISSSLASTGTPSFFLHPSEAFHGDLGMIKPADIVIAITNSGETDEILKLVPFIIENGNILVSMTGNPESTLANNSHYHLNIHVDREVCPLNLAPTTSALTTLAMGDALVVALMKERNFQPKDYARYHPGGNLGRRLLMRMKDIMATNDLPIIADNLKIIDIIQVISKCGFGLSIVCNTDSQILGVITDGDIRKCMEVYKADFFDLNANQIMKRNPVTIGEEANINEAETIFKEKKINTIIVAKNNQLAGLVTYKKLNEN